MFLRFISEKRALEYFLRKTVIESAVFRRLYNEFQSTFVTERMR